MTSSQKPGLTRREALAAATVGTAALTGVALLGAQKQTQEDQAMPPANSTRMPLAFVPHGGGPWPFVELGFGDRPGMDALRDYLTSVRALPKTPPKALLVVSAHWEERVPTVMTAEQPPMLYDYYGFPPASYQLRWPAPGQPQLAAHVRTLLEGAGFQTGSDAARGFDHGTFVPLMLTYPDAQIPTIQLSLEQGLDPARHLAMGRALAPLRDEGVFIVGSGMTFHNLRTFFDPKARPVAETFDAWLRETAQLESTERDRRLTHWSQAPQARLAHPREEHLLPLMVIAGAAGTDHATIPYNGTFGGLRLSAYHFA